MQIQNHVPTLPTEQVHSIKRMGLSHVGLWKTVMSREVVKTEEGETNCIWIVFVYHIFLDRFCRNAVILLCGDIIFCNTVK